MQKLFKTIKETELLPYLMALLVVLSGILCIFTFSVGLSSFDLWDYIEGVFWADATLKSGSIINPDYVYYYVVPFGSNLIMAPFVRLFGISFLANQMGMLVYYLIYLITAFYLAASIYENRKDRLIFFSILSLFIFTYVGDNLLHHLLIYGIGFVCCLGELSCIIQISEGKRVRHNFVLFVLFALWASVNGIACCALSNLPVLLSYLYVRCREGKLIDKNTIQTILLSTVLTMIGLLIFRHYDAQAVSLHMYEKRFVLDDISNIVLNLTQGVLGEYFRLFYFNPEKTYLFSGKGLFMLVKLVFALAVIVVPVMIRRKQKQEEQIKEYDRSRSLLLCCAFLTVLISLLQYAMTLQSTFRFLISGILSLFLICALTCTDFQLKHDARTGLSLLCLLVLLLFSKNIIKTYPFGMEKKEEIDNIRDVLISEDLTYGYTLSRYYKAIDLSSNGKCHNSTVAYDNKTGRLVVRYDRIYQEERKRPANVERFYIIEREQPQTEKEIIKKELYTKLQELCINRITVDNVTIYIFNISDWDKILIER